MCQLVLSYTREERQEVSGSVLSAVPLMGLFDRVVQGLLHFDKFMYGELQPLQLLVWLAKVTCYFLFNR